jgi:hypothetical protein
MRRHFVYVFLLLASCVSIAPQDPVAIKHATDVRVEAEMLIDRAIDPPEKHAQAIVFLRLRAKQAHEYAKAKNDNALSTKQWAIMIDERRNLLGGFLALWESKKQGFSPAFLSGVKKNILGGFDEIIKLEKAKL